MIKILCSNKSDGNMATKYNEVNGSDALANRQQFLKKRQVSNYDFSLLVPKNNLDEIEILPTPKEFIYADAAITENPGQILAVYPADCPSLAFHDRKENVIALAHCGRQSIAADLHVKVADFLIDKGSRPENLQIFISPGVKPKSYVFNMDLLHLFSGEGWQPYLAGAGTDRFSVDLNTRIINQLERAGVPKANIRASSIDTYVNHDYFSHKRSAENPQKFPEARIMYGIAMLHRNRSR